MYYYNFFLVLKKYITKIQIYSNNQFYFFIEINNLVECVNFLKKSLLFKIESLIDITAIDWLWRIFRFSVHYNFFSFFYNYRLFIIIDVPIYFNYIFGLGIESLTILFSSANWLEREVWDLFGIFFYNHFDLRRILTDYGFIGFPFRKDFPLTGYKEIRYDDTLKLILSENLKLTQEYRVFNFINPWL